MKATDLMLDEQYDLLLEGGDLVSDLSDDQHVALLLLTSQGEWRQDPIAGIGLIRYQSGPLDAPRQAALQRAGTIQLERDGYRVNVFTVSAQAELTLDATRA